MSYLRVYRPVSYLMLLQRSPSRLGTVPAPSLRRRGTPEDPVDDAPLSALCCQGPSRQLSGDEPSPGGKVGLRARLEPGGAGTGRPGCVDGRPIPIYRERVDREETPDMRSHDHHPTPPSCGERRYRPEWPDDVGPLGAIAAFAAGRGGGVMIVASHVGGFLSIDTLTIYRDRSAVNASRPAGSRSAGLKPSAQPDLATRGGFITAQLP